MLTITKRRCRIWTTLWLMLTLTACTIAPTVSRFGIDGVECVGSIVNPPAGLVESNDPDLLKSALGATSQGKLCTGKVFVAEQPVVVYRVWDAAASYTLLGRWWSFDAPTGSRDSYREKNAICPSWSALNRVSACTLKPGSKIVVGPGQSAKCDDQLTYPPSAVNQIYMANDSRAGQVWVENCTAGEVWPTGAQ